MSLTPIQRLDKVLEVIAPRDNHPATKFTDVDIISILKTSHDVLDKEASDISNQLPQILEKLVKDGYAVLVSDSTQETKLGSAGYKYYRITFEGELLNSAGGYSEQLRKANIKSEYLETGERLRGLNERRMVKGTWAVAIGAVGLVLWEIYKTFWLKLH